MARKKEGVKRVKATMAAAQQTRTKGTLPKTVESRMRRWEEGRLRPSKGCIRRAAAGMYRQQDRLSSALTAVSHMQCAKKAPLTNGDEQGQASDGVVGPLDATALNEGGLQEGEHGTSDACGGVAHACGETSAAVKVLAEQGHGAEEDEGGADALHRAEEDEEACEGLEGEAGQQLREADEQGAGDGRVSIAKPFRNSMGGCSEEKTDAHLQ